MGPKLYLQSFCTAKKTISKVKRQTSEWEKIIANETIDNLQNIQAAHEVQYQKNKQPNQKVGRRPKQTHHPNVHFSTIYNSQDLAAIQMSRCSLTDEQIKKLWYIYTMEYYSAIKRNAFESVLMGWMNLEPIIQNEVSQKKK